MTGEHRSNQSLSSRGVSVRTPIRAARRTLSPLGSFLMYCDRKALSQRISRPS